MPRLSPHKHANVSVIVSPWRNWLARSAVNRKVGGSNPPRDEIFCEYEKILFYIFKLKRYNTKDFFFLFELLFGAQGVTLSFHPSRSIAKHLIVPHVSPISLISFSPSGLRSSPTFLRYLDKLTKKECRNQYSKLGYLGHNEDDFLSFQQKWRKKEYIVARISRYG